MSDDICRNRHGGSEESESANLDNKRGRELQRARVLSFIQDCGKIGATVDEISIAFGVNPNSISGRFTELKCKGAIAKVGTRPTRTGSTAGVYVKLNGNPVQQDLLCL